MCLNYQGREGEGRRDAPYSHMVPCSLTPDASSPFRVDPRKDYQRKTTVSVLHDAQLLLNKQQQIWSGVYMCISAYIFRAVPIRYSLAVALAVTMFEGHVSLSLIVPRRLVFRSPLPVTKTNYRTTSHLRRLWSFSYVV